MKKKIFQTLCCYKLQYYKINETLIFLHTTLNKGRIFKGNKKNFNMYILLSKKF